MRTDVPIPIRRDLDAQRKAFCRVVGAGYEELLALHTDPGPWMASVVRLLNEAKAEARYRDAA